MQLRALYVAAALAACPALCGSAIAADYSRGTAAPYAPWLAGWFGPYAGLAAGYSWGETSTVETNGAFGGAFGGYNFALGANTYWGIEADVLAGNMSGTNTHGVAGKIPWLGSLNGRIGYFVGDTSFYILGGFAFGSAEEAGISNSLTGWDIGLGGEQRITGNIFGRAEYRYTDIGSNAVSGPTRAVSNSVTGGIGMHF
ncbi:MAG: outer membrane beta-barrel protein [Bauldia sp.]